MSPGRNESPLTRFSAAATTVRMRTGTSSSAAAAVPAITVAPPAMSPFMSYIFSAGFSEIPPASNVIAFPTRPTTASPFAFGGSYRRTTSRGPFALARPTALSAPMPSSSIWSGSSAMTCRCGPARSAARFARPSGVSSFGGEFARSRAQLTHFETIAATLKALDAEHSVTFGLAEAEPADSLQELIARADADLLEARRSGQSAD